MCDHYSCIFTNSSVKSHIKRCKIVDITVFCSLDKPVENDISLQKFESQNAISVNDVDETSLQVYDGPGSLFHDFKIWPIAFQGSGPSGSILFSSEKISL